MALAALPLPSQLGPQVLDLLVVRGTEASPVLGHLLLVRVLSSCRLDCNFSSYLSCTAPSIFDFYCFLTLVSLSCCSSIWFSNLASSCWVCSWFCRSISSMSHPRDSVWHQPACSSASHNLASKSFSSSAILFLSLMASSAFLLWRPPLGSPACYGDLPSNLSISVCLSFH